MERIKHPQKLGDHLAAPDAFDLSFVILFDGWVDDVERFHASVVANETATWEILIVDNPGDDDASERLAKLDGVVHIPLREHVGYGAGRNLGLRQATGTITCVVDTSVELTGAVGPALASRLADPAIGCVGRWGVTSDHDGYHFEEAPGPDVDGVEGYFMAMRRTDLSRTGLFDPKFKFYRNADIDQSFRIRDAGLRTIVDDALPLVRHEHRLWEHTSDRDELSRKNFFRFRDRWFKDASGN